MDISKLRVSSVRKTGHRETSGVRFSVDEAVRVSIFDDSIGNGKTRKMLIISFSFDTLKKLGWLDGDRINLMHIFEKDGSQSDFFVVTKNDKRLGSKLTCKSSTSGGRVRITFAEGTEPENVESHVIGVSEVIFTDCGSLIISRNKSADISALSASAK